MAYDHPGYLTRQFQEPQATTAGANGTSTFGWFFPYDIHVHTVLAQVKTAGTSAGHQVFLLAGTATVANSTVTLSTSAAGVTGTSGDAAGLVSANTPIYVKNGTDATGVAYVGFEFNVVPGQNFIGKE